MKPCIGSAFKEQHSSSPILDASTTGIFSLVSRATVTPSHTTFAVAPLILSLIFTIAPVVCVYAQPGGGGDIGRQAAERLQQAEPGQRTGANEYRGAEKVSSFNAVKQNMKDLFKEVLIKSENESKSDKWHSPHLRDSMINDLNRYLEAVAVRGQVRPFEGNLLKMICSYEFAWLFGEIPENFTACPFERCGDPHVWHGEPGGRHRPWDACYGDPTTPYKELITDSNFKLCCVRKEDKEKTSEEIASKYPAGNGWAGLFEYYYPTAAVGWENDRTTTMIVDKNKVKACLSEVDSLMEGEQAQQWIAEAIGRNLKTVGGQTVNAQNLQQEIAKNIRELRPSGEYELNRYSDSLQSQGLTMRVNFAAMDPEYRKMLAKRFCMWPNQFDKIMTSEDEVHKDDKGGLDLSQLDQIPVWSNYCPEGVELMINPQSAARLRNVDNTPTDFVTGMKFWTNDPLYCQMMQLENPNMGFRKLDVAIRTYGKQQLSEEAVGHTCLRGGHLNTRMVPPMSFKGKIERRTAIADEVMGFMIAGALAPKMIEGQKSYYKRFEPQPYSMKYPKDLRLFVGKKFAGGGENELGDRCQSLQGENYQYQNKADRLYLSNVTHQPFKQAMIDEKDDINKYVQDWAEKSQEDKIANRGLDKESQNYATAYRIMATCPSGMVVWEPPFDEHNLDLRMNIQTFCRQENHGGVSGKEGGQ